MSKRYLFFYIASLALVVVGFRAIAQQGERLQASPPLEGEYRATAPADRLQRLKLRQSGRFLHADLTLADGRSLTLPGQLQGDRLILENPAAQAGLPAQLTLSLRDRLPRELSLGTERLRWRDQPAAAGQPGH